MLKNLLFCDILQNVRREYSLERKPFFKIYIKADRLFYLTFLLVYLFVVLCECEILPFSRQGYSFVALFFIFFSFVRFEFRETLISDILLPILNSFLFTVVFQLMLSCDPSLLNTQTLIGNVALNAALSYFLLIITNRIRLSLSISNLVLFIFVFIDYLVISFRGSEIKISDFYSIRTAASVVGQYKIEFTTRINYSICILVAVMFVLWVTRITHKSKKNQIPRITGVLCLGLSLFTVSWCMNNSNNYMQLWGYEGTKYNGVTYNFLIEGRDSRVVPPENYSNDLAEKILSEYPKTESAEDTPNIIVIMSEAFSDLSVLGKVKTNVDPLSFYNSLTENTIKGYALSSVFGGNTSVSEWEFLTGNTQAFLPYGSVAYQQYIKNEASSIVDIMNDNGYTTVAMHPYLPTGWKRNVVYDVFGFDEIYFMDDLSSSHRIRGFVSDKSLFGDIIKRFETKKDEEKLFTFCITMQNHGGYEFGSFEEDVVYENADYLSVNQYLTLIKKSDDALKDLITYFQNSDEKTMIVLFGDHQPSLASQFYPEIMKGEETTFQGVQKKHTVPFMIWTNYESNEENVPIISLNFLASKMLKNAGIGLTPYFSYLDNLNTKLSAINFYGYLLNNTDTFVRNSEASKEVEELLYEYKVLQYKNIFDS